MLHSLLFAFSQDLLALAGERSLFGLPASERSVRIGSGLGSAYPQALRTYLANVSEADFARETAAFIAIMTDHRQMAGRAVQFLEAVHRALIHEVATMLDGGVTWEPGSRPSEAARILRKTVSDGREIEFGREIQRFLSVERGIASPTVQTARPLAPEERAVMRAQLLARYPGSFPTFESETSLGGGVRCFYQGTLQDESWMARATRTFADIGVGRL